MDNFDWFLARRCWAGSVAGCLRLERHRPAVDLWVIADTQKRYAKLGRAGGIDVHVSNNLCNGGDLALNGAVAELFIVRLQSQDNQPESSYGRVGTTKAHRARGA